MSNFFRTVAIAAAAICAASSASAATITYTDANRGPVFLPRFDSSLGTLQSVSFDNRYSVTASYLYNSLPGSPAPMVRIFGTIGEPAYGQVMVNEVVQSYFSAANQISVNIVKTANPIFTADLGGYIGTGSFVLGFYSLVAPGYAPALSGGSFSNVSVTYTYLAGAGAVPEPATWAMMLAGFGMVAGATRYRRRKTVIAFG